MKLNSYGDLNDIQLDALKEIGNIGSGNAASALSAMLDRPVDMKVPKIKILDYNSVIEGLGGPEELMVGLLLSMSGDVTGMIMFLLHKSFAHLVLNTLLGSELDEHGEIDEMSESAIQEVGNIMAASYVNAISSLTGLEIDISVPSLCIDMVGSILSVPTIYYANISDKIIFIEDEMSSDTESTDSHIILIPEVESLQLIMKNLGIDV